MHNLHYKNLPFALGVYCHQPEHRYVTRYTTSLNYVLPPVTTNRSKGSIKFSGPKAWADLPTHLKEIAFRKPFSKKVKDHILANIYAELPSDHNFLDREDITYIELEELFQTDDESEFYGFDIELEELFQTDDDSEFYGFDISENAHLELRELFQSDDEESDFDGFEIRPDLNTPYL